MSEVTRILSAIERGDPLAAEQLLPLVYDELRQLAAQKLARLPNLTSLYLGNTKVTEAGFARLARALPRCKIER